MNITILGTGYVGLVQGACLAQAGHQVTCVDVDHNKIKQLRQGEMPFFEPDLKELVVAGIEKKKLLFTTELREGIKNTDIIFLAVGTPSNSDGTVNMNYVKQAAIEIGRHLDHYVVVVNKSTVPVGTGQLVRKIIEKYYSEEFSVVSNPEFLAQGRAVQDFMHPDRIVIGLEDGDSRAQQIMEQVYDFIKGEKMITDIATAELIKYASNSFLATQISFINSLTCFCEAVGADVNEVAKGMKLDQRISKRAFLGAGIGYGGSCFSKDIKGLLQMGRDKDLKFPLLEQVEIVNILQRHKFVKKVTTALDKPIERAVVGIWGLSFKPNTDDIREAPSLDIIDLLRQHHVQQLRIYDPVAMPRFKQQVIGQNSNLVYTKTSQEVLDNIDILLLLTDWPEFREYNLDQLAAKLKGKIIVDGRNMWNRSDIESRGITYYGMGR